MPILTSDAPVKSGLFGCEGKPESKEDAMRLSA
jgi:hypothetical protein